MTKTILCAVDINRPEEDRKVLERAAKLADMDGAQLDIITVVPDFGANIVGAYLQDHHVSTAQDKAKKLLHDMCEATLGAEVNGRTRHIVAIGSVYEKVLQTADLNAADLIVIGAHRPDFKDYLLGPNAARIVRHSGASVYVVR
ncbi:Nucleotide-binding universal stress protein, UspA family [Aliiroseovarius crassostreae]|uniref:Universal stress protein n=1 Tax=Aliiroseovarius crassostreae TaxID=154981 RepID=A0A0P7J4N3_9RHOB|nr:universal stress protein [Aliiroseovarius crassostreae]KPN62717.1 universal stress protein [Aliiroseovarius crassostreae]SFU90581.1 Nucleotide-binding universal stress protein, UspA family [Aliiroseovarius crassostreae]